MWGLTSCAAALDLCRSDAYLKNKGDQLRVLMLLVLTQPKLDQPLLRDLVNKSKIGDPGKVSGTRFQLWKSQLCCMSANSGHVLVFSNVMRAFQFAVSRLVACGFLLLVT